VIILYVIALQYVRAASLVIGIMIPPIKLAISAIFLNTEYLVCIMATFCPALSYYILIHAIEQYAIRTNFTLPLHLLRLLLLLLLLLFDFYSFFFVLFFGNPLQIKHSKPTTNIELCGLACDRHLSGETTMSSSSSSLCRLPYDSRVHARY
jgi:hypothetical protein